MNIQAHQISLKYENQCIIDSLSNTWSKGVSLLKGPNGCGKSTLLKILAGILKPDSGSLQLTPQNIPLGSQSSKKYLSYLPDTPEFYAHVKVKDFWKMISRVRDVDSNEVNEMVIYFEAQDLGHKKFDELSLGQTKKAFLVISTLPSVPVWILDEPFNGLDQEMRQKLAHHFEFYSQNHTIILSDHHSENESQWDHIFSLKNGSLEVLS